jgi:hypothetical protein
MSEIAPPESSNVRQVFLQDIAIEKKDCAQRHGLGRGGHMPVYSEIRNEFSDFRLAHVTGVTLAMKKDVPFDPLDISVFGAQAEVLHAGNRAHISSNLGFDSVLMLIGEYSFC